MNKQNAQDAPKFESLENRTHFSAVISVEVPLSVAPGIDYVMTVKADNTGLGGQETKGVEWKVYNPGFLGMEEYTPIPGASITQPNLPTTNDFFSGKSMLSGYNYVALPGIKSARNVNIGESGVVNKSGNLGEYVFKIDEAEFLAGGGVFGAQGYFPMGAVDFVGPNGVHQSYEIASNSFTIIPEPTTVVSALVGGAALLGANRRKRSKLEEKI